MWRSVITYLLSDCNQFTLCWFKCCVCWLTARHSAITTEEIFLNYFDYQNRLWLFLQASFEPKINCAMTSKTLSAFYCCTQCCLCCLLTRKHDRKFYRSSGTLFFPEELCCCIFCCYQLHMLGYVA